MGFICPSCSILESSLFGPSIWTWTTKELTQHFQSQQLNINEKKKDNDTNIDNHNPRQV